MQRQNYLPHVDALRAVAVLAIILYHLDGRILPGGFAGVDIFFVISGFVVSKAAAQRGGASLRDFALDFVSRRIRRILPALIVCLLVTAFASALWIPPSWLSDNIPRTGQFAFYGASNIVLSKNKDRYFSPAAEFNPFTHTWSLGVEEQFYMLFPFLFFLWLRGRAFRACSFAIFALGSMASFAWSIERNVADSTSGYYMLSTRFWELAAGVILYMSKSCSWGARLGAMRGARHIGNFVVAGAVIALISTFLRNEGETLPAYGLLVPVLATMALLIVLPYRGRLPSSCAIRAIAAGLIRIGRWSYSLYLWHWPVIVLFKWTVGISRPQCIVGAVVLTFTLAWMSWRFVEQPLRTPLMTRKAKLSSVVLALAAAWIGSVTASAAIRHQAKFTLSTVAKNQKDWNPAVGQKIRGENGCRVTPSSVQLSEGRRVIFRRSHCASPVPLAPRLFAIGDSHALAYGPAFASYALQTGADVIVYNNGGCPFLSLQPWREDNEACDSRAATAMQDMLPRLEPGDVVFLPSLRLPKFVDQWVAFRPEHVASHSVGELAAHGRQVSMEKAARAIRRFRETGASVILQAPGPVLKAPAFRCADWWTRTNEICVDGAQVGREEFLAMRAPVVHALEELAKDDDGVAVFDPAETLCPEGTICDAFMNGKPLYFDGDHISAYGSTMLLPSLTEAIRRAGAKGSQ